MLNIDNSDGTLVIVPQCPLPESIVDGTRLAIDYAVQQNKPHLIISLTNKEEAIAAILDWISQYNIEVLNIGGPRESSWPGIYQGACVLFQELFVALQPYPVFGK
jgi:hypothetical protein